MSIYVPVGQHTGPATQRPRLVGICRYRSSVGSRRDTETDVALVTASAQGRDAPCRVDSFDVEAYGDAGANQEGGPHLSQSLRSHPAPVAQAVDPLTLGRSAIGEDFPPPLGSWAAGRASATAMALPCALWEIV